jgi:hypothetical protein
MYNRFNDKHTTVIKVMKELGYKANEKGVCCGLTGIFIRDIINEAADAYNERIDLMCKSDFLGNLAETKSKLQKIGLATQKHTIEISMLQKLEKVLRKSPTPPTLNFAVEIQNAKKRRQETYELEVKKHNFSELDEKYRECLPFCEAVEISQQPHLYEDHLGVKATQTSVGSISRFVDSVDAEKSRKNVRLIDIKIQSKHLNRIILQDICDRLFNILKENKLPLVIEIEGIGHTVATYYKEEIAKDSWIFFDSNQMPAYPVSPDKISYHILEGIYAQREMNYTTNLNIYFYRAENFTIPSSVQNELISLDLNFLTANIFNKTVIAQMQEEIKDQATLEKVLFSFPPEINTELLLNLDTEFLKSIIKKPLRVLKFFKQEHVNAILNKLETSMESLRKTIQDLEDSLVFYKYFGALQHEFTKPIEEIDRAPETLLTLATQYKPSHLIYLLGEKVINQLLHEKQYPFSHRLTLEEKIFYILFSRFYHLNSIHNISDAESIIFEFDKRTTTIYGIEKFIRSLQKNEFDYIEEKNFIVIVIKDADAFKKFILNELSHPKKTTAILSQNLSGLFSRTTPKNEDNFHQSQRDLKTNFQYRPA